jgi:hypothetical protein
MHEGSDGYYDSNSMDIDGRYYVDNDDDTVYPYSDAHFNHYGRGRK